MRIHFGTIVGKLIREKILTIPIQTIAPRFPFVANHRFNAKITNQRTLKRSNRSKFRFIHADDVFMLLACRRIDQSICVFINIA